MVVCPFAKNGEKKGKVKKACARKKKCVLPFTINPVCGYEGPLRIWFFAQKPEDRKVGRAASVKSPRNKKRAGGKAIPTKKRKACKPLARQRACAFGRAQEGTHNGGKAGERRNSRAVAAAVRHRWAVSRSLPPLSLAAASVHFHFAILAVDRQHAAVVAIVGARLEVVEALVDRWDP